MRPEDELVRSLQDRLEITDLVHAYAHGVDERAADAVAALFAEKCLFKAYDRPAGVARGRNEVAALLRKLLGTFEATSHHVSGTRVQLEGGLAASATTTLYAWHRFREPRPEGHLWGRYHDRLVREDGRWRFASRELRITAHRDFEFPWIPARGDCGHDAGAVTYNQPNTW